MLIFGALTRDLVNLNQFCHILVASVHPFCVIFSWLTRNDFKTLQVYQPPTVVASNHPDWQNMLCNWTFLPSFFFQSHLLAVLHCSFENQLVDFTLHLRMIEDGGFQWVTKRLGGVDSFVSIDVFGCFFNFGPVARYALWPPDFFTSWIPSKQKNLVPNKGKNTQTVRWFASSATFTCLHSMGLFTFYNQWKLEFTVTTTFCNAKLVWKGAFDLHLDFTDHTTPEVWQSGSWQKVAVEGCHSLFCFVCNFFAFPSFLPP